MDALLSCRCRLGLDGVAVPTLLLDLVLILFSGSDLVFSEVLVPSVLALSLALDLALVVGLTLAPVLVLELVLGSRLFQGLVVGFWLSHGLCLISACIW